ncbi:MAG: hypothetical protein ABFD60_01610 [Bryobacteraceae bacterium]
MLDFKINAGKVFERLKAAATRGPAAAGKELYKLANVVMTDSKQHYVPKAPTKSAGGTGISGQLRASGVVELPVENSDGSVEVRMAFGGVAGAYALAVHEDLSEYSPPSWQKVHAEGRGIDWTQSGTGPKYLEIPFLNHSRDLPVAGAQALRGAFSGDSGSGGGPRALGDPIGGE